MNCMNGFAIHRCINEGYGLIQIYAEKIRISPTKLWRVCILSQILTSGELQGFALFVVVCHSDGEPSPWKYMDHISSWKLIEKSLINWPKLFHTFRIF